MKHCRMDYEAIQPWPIERPQTEVNIAVDEPVFLLRARDVNAPDAVRFWAAATERVGGDPVTTERVRRWADEMQQWGEANGAKVPDTPPALLRP